MTHAILTCSASFTDFALNELRRHHPQLAVKAELTPQHLLLHHPDRFDQLSRPWRHRIPIYLHHVFPVHQVFPLKGNWKDLNKLHSRICKLVTSDVQVQIQIEPQLNLPYSHYVISRCRTTAAPKGRIVSVLIACQNQALTAFLGISWANQNLSPWPGGVQFFDESIPNRAGFKLLEALDTFKIRLPENGHALDLGAAPGAWTMVLRRRSVNVTAVAPTPMYPWLANDNNVSIYPMRAEDYLSECKITYDLIVNDMMMDPQDSGRMMLEYARYLRGGGIAIMTLKLRHHNRRQVMDHTYRILRKRYKIIRVRQLVSNRSEVTLFLRRKS